MARVETNTRSLKQTPIVIIGEGLTEQYYFTHIRSLFKFHFTIKPYFFGNASLFSIDRKIINVIEDGAIAVVVFDADVAARNEVEKNKLIEIKRKFSKKANVIICDSLPSIEYWFLLHYVSSNKYFLNSSAVERSLRKYLKAYAKKTSFLEKEKWVVEMCAEGKLKNAIERAKIFSSEEGSYSNIFKVFELLSSLT